MIHPRGALAAATTRDQRATHQIKAPPRSPTQLALSDHLNFGMGPGRGFFSTTPLMGSALSPMTTARATPEKRFKTPTARRAYQDGGKVEIAASALRKLKDSLLNQQSADRERAVDVLRASRDALLRMSRADGGSVAAPRNYEDLLAQLGRAELDDATQAQILNQLMQMGGMQP